MPLGDIKVWTGSAWSYKPVKYWNGSSWVRKPLKRWNGSAWVSYGGFADPYTFRLNNWASNFSNITGTSVAASIGLNNTEGTWVQLVAGSAVTSNIYDFRMWITTGTRAGVDRSMFLDLGIDTSGGSTYTPLFQNHIIGGPNGGSNSGRYNRWPLLIPAGSSIAVRVQCADPNTGGNSPRISFEAIGGTSPAAGIPYGTFTETIGITTATIGTSFTPGNAVYGSYVNLGTTSNALWQFQLGIQCNDPVMTGGHYYMELYWSPAADDNDKRLISKLYMFCTSNEAHQEATDTNVLAPYTPVPAGSKLWVRSIASSGATTTGWNASAVGIGG